MLNKNITMETLKAGAKQLGITVPKKADEKKISELIEAELSKKELAFQCSTCDKLIPDVEVCPYCGEEYSDDEDGEDESQGNEGQDENTDSNDDSNAGTDENSDSEESENTDSDQENNDTEKKEEKKEEKKNNKKNSKDTGENKNVDKKGKKAEDKKETKTEDKKGKKDKEDKVNLTPEFIKTAKKIAVDNKLKEKDGKSLLSFFKAEDEKARIFTVLKTSKTLVVYFIPSKFSTKPAGLKILSDDEAKKQHLGKIRAIYEGEDVGVAEKLILEAVKNSK